MRILIVNTDYPEFLSDLYGREPGLASRSYDDQLRARYDSLFSVADFYSRNLRALGHEARELYINNGPLQRAWAREHGVRLPPPSRPVWRMRRGVLPWRVRVPDKGWELPALLAQVRDFQPDVILNQNAFTIDDAMVRALRPLTRCLVVQHAATPLPDRDWSLYDLAISSFPPTVERFERRGLRAELHRLAFDPSVQDRLGEPDRTIPVSFVGSLHGVHSSRIGWLERVARHADLRIWTSTPEALPSGSPLRERVQGKAWGLSMYRILAASKVTLNHHGNIEPYCNNLRLFEATGVGAALVTDAKPNLSDYFDAGREVADYRSADECAEVVANLLSDDERREAMASAGQARTLQDHNWRERMETLVGSLERL